MEKSELISWPSAGTRHKKSSAQRAVVPCAGITDSSTAAFTFIHIVTHSAGPHSLPLACVYIHKTRTKQKGQLFFKSWKLQLNHDRFPQAMQFASSLFKAWYKPWNIHVHWQNLFVQTYTGLSERINRESVLLHFSLRQTCSISSTPSISHSTVLTASPFPALLSPSNTKISLSLHSRYQDIDYSRKKCISIFTFGSAAKLPQNGKET